MELRTLTDEQLVEHVRTKDQEAFLEIVLRYQDKLARYANRLTRDEAKTADIVQETFMKTFINLNSFNTDQKFSSWIYRITHNETINAVLKYKKEVPLPEDVDFKSEENIEDEIFKKEIKEQAEGCLAQIPIKYSEPLSLFFLEEKSYEEISDILRLPIGTVGTRINRAKILIKKICQKIN
jgi:RNA polymerase sigma-70 factor (ECF subfamily)